MRKPVDERRNKRYVGAEREEMRGDRPFTVACDWDGVIHTYLEGMKKRVDVMEDPIVPGAIEWLTECHMAGVQVIIHSTRFIYSDNTTSYEVKEAMIVYLVKHGCPPEVANSLEFWMDEGKPRADIYLDDRGFRFEGAFPSPSFMRSFDVWNRNERTKARAEAKRRAEYEEQADAGA